MKLLDIKIQVRDNLVLILEGTMVGLAKSSDGDWNDIIWLNREELSEILELEINIKNLGL